MRGRHRLYLGVAEHVPGRPTKGRSVQDDVDGTDSVDDAGFADVAVDAVEVEVVQDAPVVDETSEAESPAVTAAEEDTK